MLSKHICRECIGKENQELLDGFDWNWNMGLVMCPEMDADSEPLSYTDDSPPLTCPQLLKQSGFFRAICEEGKKSE